MNTKFLALLALGLISLSSGGAWLLIQMPTSLEPSYTDVNQGAIRVSIVEELDTLIIELPVWATTADLEPELRSLENLAELQIAEHALILKRKPDRPWLYFMADVFGVMIRLGHMTAPQANKLLDDIELKFGRKIGQVRYPNKAGEPTSGSSAVFVSKNLKIADPLINKHKCVFDTRKAGA